MCIISGNHKSSILPAIQLSLAVMDFSWTFYYCGVEFRWLTNCKFVQLSYGCVTWDSNRTQLNCGKVIGINWEFFMNKGLNFFFFFFCIKIHMIFSSKQCQHIPWAKVREKERRELLEVKTKIHKIIYHFSLK